MIKIENECVDCGFPCKGSACPYNAVPHYYCDECGDEGTLYDYDGEELCCFCLLKRFEIVKGSDY